MVYMIADNAAVIILPFEGMGPSRPFVSVASVSKCFHRPFAAFFDTVFQNAHCFHINFLLKGRFLFSLLQIGFTLHTIFLQPNLTALLKNIRNKHS